MKSGRVNYLSIRSQVESANSAADKRFSNLAIWNYTTRGSRIKIATTNAVGGTQLLQLWDMVTVVAPPSACQRHVDLKNLTCLNVAKQLKGFRLEHFFCSAPFPHSLPALVCLTLSHTHTHTQACRAPSVSVWRT